MLPPLVLLIISLLRPGYVSEPSRTEPVAMLRGNSSLAFWGGEGIVAGWWSLAKYFVWLHTHLLLPPPPPSPLNSDQGSPLRPRLSGLMGTLTLCPLSLQQGLGLQCLSVLVVAAGWRDEVPL